MEARIERRIGLSDPGLGTIDTMSLAPLLDLDFTQGRHYAHRSVVASALTFTRASSALDYSVQPAVLRATNIPRYMQNSAVNGLNGILIEGADTNVCIRNTKASYQAGDWTIFAPGSVTASAVASPDLYDGSIKLISIGGDFMQQVTLTAVKYVLSALVYAEGGVDPSTIMTLYANVAVGAPSLTANYEHLGNNVYLVWAVFTGTAALWYVGLTGLGTYYFNCLTCHIAAPTSEGGDFPRSPIPNTTAASITRAADLLSITATGNFNEPEGTIDLETVTSIVETGPASHHVLFQIHQDNINFLRFMRVANTNYRFTHISGGVERFAVATPTAPRGTVMKWRMVWRRASTLDGTNYLLLYGDKGTGWSLLGQTNLQPSAAFTATTIYMGNDPSSTNLRHPGDIYRRIRIKAVAEVGIPTW